MKRHCTQVRGNEMQQQEGTRESGTDKIVLDLSDNPIQETRLIVVLSEMVKTAIEKAEASETNDHESTGRGPECQSKGFGDASTL
jgi:hypothetical protein